MEATSGHQKQKPTIFFFQKSITKSEIQDPHRKGHTNIFQRTEGAKKSERGKNDEWILFFFVFSFFL
jgi:hypothetical protein